VVERIFAVNVYGPLSMIQNVIPLMPRGGRIINIGSIASKTGTPQVPLYVASKAAMDALAFAMAKEVRIRRGLHGLPAVTNIVCPDSWA
jgi:NAD(P)-dependent dehydrogenase (short-subunit alcohol dehydrogenase family)